MFPQTFQVFVVIFHNSQAGVWWLHVCSSKLSKFLLLIFRILCLVASCLFPHLLEFVLLIFRILRHRCLGASCLFPQTLKAFVANFQNSQAGVWWPPVCSPKLLKFLLLIFRILRQVFSGLLFVPPSFGVFVVNFQNSQAQVFGGFLFVPPNLSVDSHSLSGWTLHKPMIIAPITTYSPQTHWEKYSFKCWFKLIVTDLKCTFYFQFRTHINI